MTKEATPSPLLLTSGYRPFFLLTALYGVVSLLLWLTAYQGGLPLTSSWHGHEMIFGFGVAAIGGFLMAAVPNWTGRPSAQGIKLLGLIGLWLAGRIAVYLETQVWIDLLFLPAAASLVAIDIIKTKNFRNLIVPAILFGLTALNVMYHYVDPYVSLRAATYLMTGLVALIGGRVVPAFTNNALPEKREPTSFDAVRPKLDVAALISIFLMVIVEIISPESTASGIMALILGTVLGLRMIGWRSLQTKHMPIVWILHVGYVWLPIGYVLKGLSDIWYLVAPTSALHALTVGAIGTMIMAVSSRAALGHSGRPLKVSSLTVTAYSFIILAAITRVFLPADMYAVDVSGTFWILSYGLFAIVYWPILTKPRVDGKPG